MLLRAPKTMSHCVHTPSAAGGAEHPGSPVKQVHSGGRTMLRSVGALATWPAIGLRLQDVALLGVFLAAYVGLEWVELHPRAQGPAGHALEPGSWHRLRPDDPEGRPLRARPVRRRRARRDPGAADRAGLADHHRASARSLSASYAAAADVARRLLRLDVGLNHLRDVFMLLAAGAAGAAFRRPAVAAAVADASSIAGDVLVTAALPSLSAMRSASR